MSANDKDIKNNIELAHYDFSLFDNSYVATVVIHVDLNESGIPYDFTIVYGNEKIANMFRTKVDEFVDKKYYKELTNVDIEDSVVYPIIQVAKQYDLIEENDRQVKLTTKGSFFADEVVGLFYNPKYNPFKKEEFKDGTLNPYFLNK